MYELRNVQKKLQLNQEKINFEESVNWSEQLTAEFIKVKETLDTCVLTICNITVNNTSPIIFPYLICVCFMFIFFSVCLLIFLIVVGKYVLS